MKTRLQGKKGAALVVVVLSMIAAGLVGTAILSMATSARYERLYFGIANQAYYLAESGASYVRARRAIDPLFGISPPAPITVANTMANGDQFIVTINLANMTNDVGGLSVTSQHVLVESTGIANPGTPLEARQQIHFDIAERGIASNASVSFYDEDGEFNRDLWDWPTDPHDIHVYEHATGHSGEEDLAVNYGVEEGTLSLSWQSHPALNLYKTWMYHDKLLSYDVQLKSAPYENAGVGFGQHHMLGISFRLQTNGGSYGLSYFRSVPVEKDRDRPPWAQDARLDAGFEALRGTNHHVVLWYRAASNAVLQLLASHRLLPSDNVLKSYPPSGIIGLIPYSTLLLQLDEEYTDASHSNRQNRIVAYIQSQSNCPSCYPNWPNTSTSNVVWQENTTVFPAPLVFSNNVGGTWTETTNVIDSLLTSASFYGVPPPEIGVHVFYDSEGANLQFFDDFALRLEGFGSTTGGTQIQW